MDWFSKTFGAAEPKHALIGTVLSCKFVDEFDVDTHAGREGGNEGANDEDTHAGREEGNEGANDEDVSEKFKAAASPSVMTKTRTPTPTRISSARLIAARSKSKRKNENESKREKSFHVGRFENPTLRELRNRLRAVRQRVEEVQVAADTTATVTATAINSTNNSVTGGGGGGGGGVSGDGGGGGGGTGIGGGTGGGGGGGIRYANMCGDVRTLHKQRSSKHAVFQVASQFNCLEMVGPGVTPEVGFMCYYLKTCRVFVTVLFACNGTPCFM
jgi:hypothetical protein